MEQMCSLCGAKLSLEMVPRMMSSCEHTACTSCLQAVLDRQDKMVTCKTCGVKGTVEEKNIKEFSKNIALIKALQAAAPTEHQQPKGKDAPKDTNGTSSEDHLTQEPVEECPIHKKDMDIICLNDIQRICAHCAIFGEHKEHKFKTITELKEQMARKKAEFEYYRRAKETLDCKINNPQFKEELIKRMNNQKDSLISQIRGRFAELYENIVLAEKGIFEDVIKKFKQVYRTITELIKQQNEAYEKYKQWERQCSSLFVQAAKSLTIQDKASFYFGGPLQQCGQGQRHIKRIDTKINQNIQTMMSLISNIKINIDSSVNKSLFNFVSVYIDDTTEQHSNSGSATMEHQGQSRTKPLTVEFTSDKFIDPHLDVYSPKRQRRNTEDKSKYPLSSSSVKIFESPMMDMEVKNRAIQKIITDFKDKDQQETLDLMGQQLSDIEIYEILKYLKTIKKTKGLKLSKNKLSNDGLIRIMEYIPHVTNLNVSFNNLTEQILTFLMINREKVPSLRIINVSNNKINERKAKVTIEELKKIGIIATI